MKQTELLVSCTDGTFSPVMMKRLIPTMPNLASNISSGTIHCFTSPTVLRRLGFSVNNCHLETFIRTPQQLSPLAFFVLSDLLFYFRPLQEAFLVASEPRTICSNRITSSVIQLGSAMLLRNASQIEHKTSTQHNSATSLPGIH